MQLGSVTSRALGGNQRGGRQVGRLGDGRNGYLKHWERIYTSYLAHAM